MSISPERSGESRARRETRRFARRLLAAMSVIVAVVAAAGIVLARKQLQAAQAEEATRGHAAEFAAAQALRRLRLDALADRARALVGRPRIHAALEDDALDLLYLVAGDELRDLFVPRAPNVSADDKPEALRARFYRFFDAEGRLIAPQPPASPGEATEAELAALAPKQLERGPVFGAVISPLAGGSTRASELLAMPIRSREGGRLLGCLVLGFDATPALLAPVPVVGDDAANALWVNGRLHAPGLGLRARASLEAEMRRRLASAAGQGDEGDEIKLDGRPTRLFRELINGGQAYPPVYKIRLTSLAGLRARQSAVTWQITAAGVFLVGAGFVVSGLLTVGFSGWFGRLAEDSEQQRVLRNETETRLGRTAAELERAARFAADASHQLKTPVAVLRIGLQELAVAPTFPEVQREDVGDLVRQTDRLAHILDTLLLLSRLDAGLLRARPHPVDLAALAATALDDLSVLPHTETLALENTVKGTLMVSGEATYLAMILQNLLENAAKYNRPGGYVRLSAERSPGAVRFLVANTAPIPVRPEARERIFERFHRGSAGGDVPGYGLGLDLSRHLARVHGGEVRLVQSDSDWTIFELVLPALVTD